MLIFKETNRKYTRGFFMGNEINIALLQMLPGKDITENMEKA